MSRFALALALVASTLVAVVGSATAADGPVRQFAQPVTLGFYKGRVVSYFDFGPVKLAKGNRTAPIWVVTNGVVEQRNIIDTVPGKSDYSPLWAVRTVTWKVGVSPRLLRSRAAVTAAVGAGDVVVRAAPVVVNCPVL